MMLGGAQLTTKSDYQLCIESWNGRTLVAVESIAASHPKEDKHRFRHIPLSVDDARLGLDLLKRLYAREIFGSSPEERVKDAKLVERLVAIIKTSHFEGEIDNAKLLYAKITGRNYAG